MNNQLTKTQQQPIGELMQLAKAFADSGMFPDTKQATQAIVKIQAGQEIGIPPFAAMTGIYIIQGKPTIGAGLIASRVKGSEKYDYKVVEQSEAKCSIDFYQGKELIGNSTFTKEDAVKAGTKNLDKYPRNMLFARAISNGVKWFCPDIFLTPVYVPEEMETVDAKWEEMPKDDKEVPPRLPLISNKALKDACERLKQGELQLSTGEQFYDKLIDTYSFDPTQRRMLDEAWQTGCKEADKKLQPEAALPFN